MAEFFTALGHVPFFLLTISILYWTWDKRAISRVTIALLLTAHVNLWLKDFFQDPRPSAYFMEGHATNTYGLPSGHTQEALVFWYALALEIRKRWAWIVGTIFVFGISFSRLYLGVHDLEDVVGGAILGVATLAAYLVYLRFRERVPRLTWIAPIGLFAAIVSLFFWPNAIPPPDAAVLLVGYFLGWLSGIALEETRCDFKKKPPTRRTVQAVLLGLVAVMVLAGGLGLGFWFLVERGWLWDYLAIAMGSTATGFFVAFLAPCLFVRAGLMDRGVTPGSPRA
ncbi:MAG: phosphatase PAP2 family protein [Verrucomicrobiota bacterium]